MDPVAIFAKLVADLEQAPDWLVQAVSNVVTGVLSGTNPIREANADASRTAVEQLLQAELDKQRGAK